ncbi:MAG: BPSS1780 family membrane protein [Azovibrio sp.]|uniref:BPSS1780 family membrane protein n=1 Tax=Azovibrio sp. TaxID=1872673 RepID=UPI003C777F44
MTTRATRPRRTMIRFPLDPIPFKGRSRVTDPGAGFDWLRQGWIMFRATPGRWLGLSLSFLLGLLVPAGVSLPGLLLSSFLLPPLAAGMLSACRRSIQEGAPRPGDLLAGFVARGGGVMGLGLLNMLGTLGIVLLLFLLNHTGQAGNGPGIEGMGGMGGMGGIGPLLGGLLLSGLLAVILFLPLAMALWFAPALVLLQGMAPVPAIKASVSACLKNWLAFLVFGLLLSLLSFFATLPLGLGFLILIPVLSGALYASYRDIFLGV